MEQESVEQFDYSTKIEELQKFSKIFTSLFSEILVCYDLDSLYYEDSDEAMKKLKLAFDKEELPFAKRSLIVIDFEDHREKMLAKIDAANEDDKEEMQMLLFYVVHSFERVVNQHIYFELQNMSFTQKELERITYLSTEDKLGWVLRLICGKDYTSSNKWPLLNKFIKTRNYFIHYSPDTWEAVDNREVDLRKKAFISFLDNAYDCYLFLNECTSKEIKDVNQRVLNIKKYMEKKFEDMEFTLKEYDDKLKEYNKLNTINTELKLELNDPDLNKDLK
jgi:hypothetical protein